MLKLGRYQPQKIHSSHLKSSVIRMSKELSDFKIVIMFLFVVRMIQLYIVKMLHFNTLTVWDNWCPWQKILFVSFYLLFKNSLVFLRFGPKNCTSFTQSLRTFIAQTMLTGAFSIFHFHFHKTKATQVHMEWRVCQSWHSPKIFVWTARQMKWIK